MIKNFICRLITQMTDNNFELIENSDYEDFNQEMLHDYWSFRDVEQRKFTYTVKALLTKYDIKTQDKFSRIIRHSGHLGFKKLLDCKKCYKTFKISARKEIDFDKSRWFHTQLICGNCRKLADELHMKEYLVEFKQSIPLDQQIENQPPTAELKYLEKIFLYSLLTNVKIVGKNSIPPQDWNTFKEVEANGLPYILNNLMEKGYIVNINQYDIFKEKQDDLRKLYNKSDRQLSNELKDEVNYYLRLSFNSEINVEIPKDFNSFDDWIEKLYEEIIEEKLLVSDYKELEKFILNKRLLEVYSLLDYVCQLKSIPVKKNNAFELDLMRMLLKYDLQHVLAIFMYMAKQTAADLYDMSQKIFDVKLFMKEPIFGRHLASYLDHLERKNEKPKYPRQLPENWTYSEIELFVSAQVIRNYEKWEKFTPHEILSLWMEAKGVELTEE